MFDFALNLKEIGSYFCIEMYRFVGSGAVQKVSTAKLAVLSKTIETSMIIVGLALIIYHNIKQFTNS